ncbi:MFS transporter, partial [Escherichia coli]|nr:MFS transporter [Escherichia coli]
ILLFSVRILDAVIDPVVGTMTDITNTRWGKYRPWLLFMSIPFGISIWLMFTTPDTDYSVKLLWAWATYVLLTLTYTLIAIPYVSLISVITDDP